MDPWGYMQNPFHRLRVRHSYAYFETTIFQMCLAIFLKKCHLSILAFHKYYIIEELIPNYKWMIGTKPRSSWTTDGPEMAKNWPSGAPSGPLVESRAKS